MDEVNPNGSEAQKRGVVSMRLRPQEQDMFSEIAQAYGLDGSTNAVRAAGRILQVLKLDQQTFLSLLAEYEKVHSEAVPCKFVLEAEET